jgi:UDP-galactopyranose mutase
MKILIVGAGFSGATIARLLAKNGFHVDVIDKRNHVAGNAFDVVNQYGIRVHQYGPHLFHTSNMRVVDFLSEFTTWIDYKHKVKAQLKDGRLVTLPVNNETQKIVGKDNILNTFFRPYTKKMWGLDLEQLDPEILSRVPVRDDDNEFYFPNDTFQAMPAEGYTKLVQNMLDHEYISVHLNTEFTKQDAGNYLHIFNSMPIDEYFDFQYGHLPYRSIRFHNYTIPSPLVYPVATVNFTHDEKYTRVTEWKHLPNHGRNDAYTSLTFEEPCDYSDNNFERYYPIKDIDGKNRKTYTQYLEKTAKNMTFIGRCGLYAYLDMHQAVSSSFKIATDYMASYRTNHPIY